MVTDSLPGGVKKPLKARLALFLLILLLALWLPRGLALDRFVTVGEPKWLERSASFYNALAHGDWRGTFQREHPGVTITWAGVAGFLWRFPGYYKIAPQQEMTPTRFQAFLERSGRSSLELLVAGRTLVVLGIVTALGLSFLIAARLLGAATAAFAFLLVAFDPFSIALSRLLHLDGLMSALMLLSILAFVDYLTRGKSMRSLVFSGIIAGLAWLTKSPAFFLAPFFGLLVLVHGSASTHRSTPAMIATVRQIWRTFSPLLLWFAIAAAVFVLLWPAMWVDPLGSLGRVFSQATAYASEGHEHPGFFYGEIYPGGKLPWTFYPLVTLWRLTPVVLAGLVWALLALFFPRRLSLSPDRRRLVGVLLGFSLLFAVFMSLGAKKFDRYLLPVFAPLDLVAGLGWLSLAEALGGLAKNGREAARRWGGGLLLGAIILMQLFGVLQTAPYYFNYYNPLLGGHRRAAEVLLVGWGEGLDQAARYLKATPHSEKARAIAWYGDGCFSYFYDGTTVPVGLDMTLSDLRKTDYVVLYRNQWQRQLPSAEFIAYFAQLTPEYVVRIDGIEYVRVYNLRDVP